jgi:hypothetical protein
LILEEQGDLPFERRPAHVFLQLVTPRYEKRSLLVRTNQRVSDWALRFGDQIRNSCWRSREEGILAAYFAGVVPASRGAHCRPLHPWLASVCSAQRVACTLSLIR